MTLTHYILRLAVAFLPLEQQERFSSEWDSEIAVLRSEHGDRAAVAFALRLVTAAPRITREIRANSETAYIELSLAAAVTALPPMVLVVVAIASQVWIMVLAQLVHIVGTLLVASGVWRHDGRFLDSRRSRLGLLLFLISGAAGMAIIRLTELGPARGDEQVNAAIPNLLILVGVAVLAFSNYAGPFHRKVQLVAVTILAPASAFSFVVVLINAAVESGLLRFAVLVYALPTGFMAWACYSILGRPQVFGEAAPVEI